MIARSASDTLSGAKVLYKVSKIASIKYIPSFVVNLSIYSIQLFYARVKYFGGNYAKIR